MHFQMPLPASSRKPKVPLEARRVPATAVQTKTAGKAGTAQRRTPQRRPKILKVKVQERGEEQ